MALLRFLSMVGTPDRDTEKSGTWVRIFWLYDRL